MNENKEKDNTDKKEKYDEFLRTFIDLKSTPEGLGNDRLTIMNLRTLSILAPPYLVFFLSVYENIYVFWGLHVFSLLMVICYTIISSKLKEHMAYSLNPFDFVRAQLLCFVNVVVFFGFSFFYLSQAVTGQFNSDNIPIFDFIYYSFVTVTTLGYGDIYPEGWYGKLLAIVELLFGLWFVITVLPVAVADQAERLRIYKEKYPKYIQALEAIKSDKKKKEDSQD